MNPYWLLLIVPVTVCFGFLAAALMAASGRGDLIADNMRLRERLAGCEQMNDQMRRLNDLNSKGAADFTELQEE